jgi:hypothetical protein
MRNLIHKILKEESEDFDWTNEVNPLEDFGDFFYGRDHYTGYRIIVPGIYIGRDIEWWYNWIHEVEMAHASFLGDIEELNDMVHDLVNPIDGSEKYRLLSNDVYSFLSPLKALGGKSMLQDSASTIKSAYDVIGVFAEKNNLTILETLVIFEEWLDKMKYEGKPLHKSL